MTKSTAAKNLPESEQLRLCSDGFRIVAGKLLDQDINPELVQTALLSYCVNSLTTQCAENRFRTVEWLESIIDLLNNRTKPRMN